MALATWIRERLWPAESWSDELARLRREVSGEPAGPRRAARAYELARACEHCDPDRGHALELYLLAARSGHAEARAQGARLAADLRSHVAVAELALAADDLVLAGAAYLDAGLGALAAAPLHRHVTRAAGADRAEAHALLALARQEPLDVDRAIGDALARAGATRGAEAVAHYVHAARLARLGGRPERQAAIHGAASRAQPDRPEIAALVEARLAEAHDTDGLLAHHRARFERAPTRAAYVDLARRAALGILAHNLQPGLGLRLLRMCLEHAYREQIGPIVDHVAAWEHLVAHATAQHSTLELVPLLVQAMGAPLPDDDAVYLARTGLAIVWTDGQDTLAAQPYAAVVLDFVRDHPLASALVATVAGQPAPARRPSTPIAPIVAPAVAPAAPPTRTTAQMQPLDGPVKRSGPATAAVTRPGVAAGRLALLRPPPPRETPLVRDASPIPAQRRPHTPTAPRAPRAIVPVDARVTTADGATFTAVLRDASTTGAFIVTRVTLAVGAPLILELKVLAPGTLQQVTHQTRARVMRVTDVGIGVAFDGPSAELVALLRGLI